MQKQGKKFSDHLHNSARILITHFMGTKSSDDTVDA